MSFKLAREGTQKFGPVNHYAGPDLEPVCGTRNVLADFVMIEPSIRVSCRRCKATHRWRREYEAYRNYIEERIREET